MSKAKKYKVRDMPYLTVEAIQYFREKNIADVHNWFAEHNSVDKLVYDPETNEYFIHAGVVKFPLNNGNYIIKDRDREGIFYPYNQVVFNRTYEEVKKR